MLPIPIGAPLLATRLWIYTNYDCNLKCDYCLAESSPRSDRRAMSLEIVRRLIDEAPESGFTELFFTGGEPFLHPAIYDILGEASCRMRTTVLTNAMLFQGKRLEKLNALKIENLIFQVSLDGGNPDDHDAYRGKGTWVKTVAGIRMLQDHGFQVRISTTQTPANRDRIDQVCAFHRELGIPEENHVIRQMARRGFAQEGVEVGIDHIAPELTVDIDGVYWHPISTDDDMHVCRSIFPLRNAVEKVNAQLETIARTGKADLTVFT